MSAQSILARADQAVLVLIDVQERLVPALADFEPVLANLDRWLRAAPILGVPVVVTEQYPKGLGPTLPALAELAPPAIAKLSFSCFGSDDFSAAVADRQDLILVGAETHVCVLLTALDALAAGRRVYVPGDAVTSRSAASRDLALTALRDQGVSVVPTETLLFSMLGHAGTDQFRAISRLVK